MLDAQQNTPFVTEANLHIQRLWALHDILSNRTDCGSYFFLVEKVPSSNRKLYVAGYQELLAQHRRDMLGEPQISTTLMATKKQLDDAQRILSAVILGTIKSSTYSPTDFDNAVRDAYNVLEESPRPYSRSSLTEYWKTKEQYLEELYTKALSSIELAPPASTRTASPSTPVAADQADTSTKANMIVRLLSGFRNQTWIGRNLEFTGPLFILALLTSLFIPGAPIFCAAALLVIGGLVALVPKFFEKHKQVLGAVLATTILLLFVAPTLLAFVPKVAAFLSSITTWLPFDAIMANFIPELSAAAIVLEDIIIAAIMGLSTLIVIVKDKLLNNTPPVAASPVTSSPPQRVALTSEGWHPTLSVDPTLAQGRLTARGMIIIDQEAKRPTAAIPPEPSTPRVSLAERLAVMRQNSHPPKSSSWWPRVFRTSSVEVAQPSMKISSASTTTQPQH